jgi:hypothetical protein
MFVQMQAFGSVERDPELRVTKDGTPHRPIRPADEIYNAKPQKRR